MSSRERQSRSRRAPIVASLLALLVLGGGFAAAWVEQAVRSERERVASDNAQRDKAALEADASEMAQLAVPYEAVIKARGLSSVTLDGRVYYAYVPFPSGHADCTSATDCRLLRMLPVVDCWTLSYRTWYHAPMGAVRKGDSGVFQFPKAGELVEVHLDVFEPNLAPEISCT